MDPGVHQQAAADHRRVLAPAAVATADPQARVGRAQGAELARPEQLEEAPVGRVEELVVGDGDAQPLLGGDGGDRIAGGEVDRERLLEQHVATGAQRRHRRLLVQGVRQADVDGVEPLALEHPSQVRVGGRLAGAGAGQPLVEVADRRQLQLRGRGDRAQVVLADLAEAAEPDPHARSPAALGSSARTWEIARRAAASGSDPSTCS